MRLSLPPWLLSLPLRVKVLTAVGIACLVALLIGVLGLVQLGNLQQRSEDIKTNALVPSNQIAEAYNFGRAGVDNHQVRYGRAQEFVEVCKGLWDSWDDDAFTRLQALRDEIATGQMFHTASIDAPPSSRAARTSMLNIM